MTRARENLLHAAPAVGAAGGSHASVATRHEHRARSALYHSALEVHLGSERWVIEMTPVRSGDVSSRGVVQEGPVGSRMLGRSALFRYEVRCWRDGVIPDLAEAVGGPLLIGEEPFRACELLGLVPQVPALTWGRDELQAGEMWNSNSLSAWLLSQTGHDLSTTCPPVGGRAPGWRAGLALSADQSGRPRG